MSQTVDVRPHQFGCQFGQSGYVVEYVPPLCAGGPDALSNMQWQTGWQTATSPRLDPEEERSHMERLTWIAIFAATLAELRPQLSARAMHALGEHFYATTDEDPARAARTHHQACTGSPPKAQLARGGP